MAAPSLRLPRLALVAAVALVALAACQVSVDPRREGFACNAGGTCENGLVCENGVCVLPGGDGGTPSGSVTKVIGFDGGDVSLGEITVHFPLGALASDTNITLSRAPGTSAAGYSAQSDVVTVAPAGLPLARPAVITVPVASLPDAGYWSAPVGTGYERVGVETGGGTATLRVVRLGSGFAAMHAAQDTTLTVYGVVADIRSTAKGPDVSPWDLTGYQVQVLDVAGNPYAGSGDANGILRIRGVPPSKAYEIGYGNPVANVYAITTSATIDFSELAEGRVYETAASTGTTLTLAGSGMTAFSQGDDLEAYVPNLDLLGGPVYPTSGLPAAGATSFTGAMFDWSLLPLVDGTMGDELMLFHVHTVTTGAGDSFTTIVDAVSTGGIATQDGANTNASLGFSPVTTVGSQTVIIDRQAFLQAVPTIPSFTGLGQQSTSLGFYIDGFDTPATFGATASYVDLLTGWLALGSGPDDLGALSFADPSAGSYTLGASVQAYVTAQVSVGTGSDVYTAMWLVDVGGPPGTLFASTVKPAVGVPGSVVIAGRPATGPLTKVGTTPVIRWKQTGTGRSDYYVVRISDVSPSGSGSAFIMTKGTSIQVPPGVLVSGHTYFAVISAMSTNEIDPVHAPWSVFPINYSRGMTTTPPFSP